MSRPRQRNKTPGLRHVEPAIVRGYSGTEEHSPDARLYVTALDVNSTGLQVYTHTPLPIGEVLELSVYLEGQPQPHILRGITRWVGHSDGDQGFVLGLELLDEQDIRLWRRQFH